MFPKPNQNQIKNKNLKMYFKTKYLFCHIRAFFITHDNGQMSKGVL